MDNDELELGHYGRIFRRSWWMLALAVVATVILALLFLPSPRNFYESSVSVQLIPSEADVGRANDPISEETEAIIAAKQGDTVVAANQFDVTLDDWTENLLVSACLNTGALVVTTDCNTQILEFTYRGETPAEAAGLVELSATTYLDYRFGVANGVRQTNINRLTAQLDDLDLRISTEESILGTFEPDSVEYTLSEIRLRRLEPERLEIRSDLNVLEGNVLEVGRILGTVATPVEDSTGIPRPFAIVAGILMGLLLGGLAAVLTDRLDRRVSSAAETEIDLSVPVLGDIPRITDDSPALVTAVGSTTPGAEAFRRLAAAAVAPRNGYVVDSITVTGANDNEGRTTVAVNLGLAIAQSGRRVLLVGADRRNDALDRLFGLVGHLGVNDFLRSVGDLDAARTAIDHCEERLGLHILPTGTGAAAPLTNNGLAALLAVAAERNMIVVFDSPPALTHADGLQLASVADAVYIVAAVGRTRRSELTELRVQLLNVQADVAGAVLNRNSRLSLLPTGAGDIGTVRVPTGVPGNNKGSVNPFQQSAPFESLHRMGTHDAASPPQASPNGPEPVEAEVVGEDDPAGDRA